MPDRLRNLHSLLAQAVNAAAQLQPFTGLPEWWAHPELHSAVDIRSTGPLKALLCRHFQAVWQIPGTRRKYFKRYS